MSIGEPARLLIIDLTEVGIFIYLLLSLLLLFKQIQALGQIFPSLRIISNGLHFWYWVQPKMKLRSKPKQPCASYLIHTFQFATDNTGCLLRRRLHKTPSSPPKFQKFFFSLHLQLNQESPLFVQTNHLPADGGHTRNLNVLNRRTDSIIWKIKHTESRIIWTLRNSVTWESKTLGY